MDEADRQLEAAAALRHPGPYQIEATIQAAHGFRRHGGAVPWGVIADLHDALAALAPSIGVLVSRAAAVGQARGAAEGMVALAGLDEALTGTYQPYWALRAHLLAELGDTVSAREAYARAAGLTTDPSVRRFLLTRAQSLA